MLIIFAGVMLGAIVSLVVGEGFEWLGASLGGLLAGLYLQMRKVAELERNFKLLSADFLALKKQIIQFNTQNLTQDNGLAQAQTQGQSEPLLQSQIPTSASVLGYELSNKTPVGSPEPGSKSLTVASEAPQTAKLAQDTPLHRDVQASPPLWNRLIEKVKTFFLQGNPIVRVGMVVMFFGMSFLVKYASSQGLLPVEVRLAGALIGASALIGLGWKTRNRQAGFGLVLQGGGVAIMYLALFASAKLYGLVPLTLAFILLTLVVGFGVLLAVLQNAQVLALLASAGGFIAPILTSDGSGNHVGLFSFYLILNGGILAIAFYKSWRMLNWVGFIFTFVIASTWGVLQYSSQFYWSTQPFLIGFFLMYLALSILFSFKQAPQLKGLVDGSLVFGLPLVAFGLQVLLLKSSDYGLAISALVLAAVYLALAAWLAKLHIQTHQLLATAFLALGFSFITMAIPLALNAQWTCVTWALEAAGVVWIGVRQNRLRPRVVGYALHLGAAGALCVNGIHTGVWPILSGSYLSMIFLTVTAGWMSYLCLMNAQLLHRLERIAGMFFLAVSVVWWHIANTTEIGVHALQNYRFTEELLYLAFTVVVVQWLAMKTHWPELLKTNYVVLLLLWISCIGAYMDRYGFSPSSHWVFVGLILVTTALYRFLHWEDARVESNVLDKAFSINAVAHVMLGYLLFFITIWETQWQVNHFVVSAYWARPLWFLVFALPIMILFWIMKTKIVIDEEKEYAQLKTKTSSWPFFQYQNLYKYWIPAPAWLLLAILFTTTCAMAVPRSVQNYMPLLNPLDLVQCFTLLIFAYGIHKNCFFPKQFILQWSAFGGALFVLINVMLLRSMATYLDIEYRAVSLWNVSQIQMALSILWTLCALVLMNTARRLYFRRMWILGAILLAVVVLKLFTKDLSDSGTLTNIVSFLVVGMLMLLIGYFSPAPKVNLQKSQEQDPAISLKGNV